MRGAFKPLKGLGAYPKKNILTPLLWLAGITFPISCAAFVLSPWPKGTVVFAIGCLPVLAVLWYYKHWAKEDADRLQTEEYRLQIEVHRARFGSEGNDPVLIDQRTGNVENPMLEHGGGK